MIDCLLLHNFARVLSPNPPFSLLCKKFITNEYLSATTGVQYRGSPKFCSNAPTQKTQTSPFIMCSGIVTHPTLELWAASPSKTFQIQKDTSENGESLTQSARPLFLAAT